MKDLAELKNLIQGKISHSENLNFPPIMFTKKFLLTNEN